MYLIVLVLMDTMMMEVMNFVNNVLLNVLHVMDKHNVRSVKEIDKAHRHVRVQMVILMIKSQRIVKVKLIFIKKIEIKKEF